MLSDSSRKGYSCMKKNSGLSGAGADRILKKRLIGFIIAAALIAAFTLIPPFEGLTEPAMASIGIFLGAIILFVFQVAPLAVSCLTLMVLLPYFNILQLGEIWAQFGGTSFFFVFSASALPAHFRIRRFRCVYRPGSPGYPKAIRRS